MPVLFVAALAGDFADAFFADFAADFPADLDADFAAAPLEDFEADFVLLAADFAAAFVVADVPLEPAPAALFVAVLPAVFRALLPAAAADAAFPAPLAAVFLVAVGDLGAPEADPAAFFAAGFSAVFASVPAAFDARFFTDFAALLAVGAALVLFASEAGAASSPPDLAGLELGDFAGVAGGAAAAAEGVGATCFFGRPPRPLGRGAAISSSYSFLASARSTESSSRSRRLRRSSSVR